MATLSRQMTDGVTLLTDVHVGSGVTFGFTERTGGVSLGAFASLNLGAACNDDPAAVATNRARALRAIGADTCACAPLSPRQVHGSAIVALTEASAEAYQHAVAQGEKGADAVVCTVADVPVLMCFADCVPVVLVAPGGFAVAHSGWRGTKARISALAVAELCRAAHVDAHEVVAYIGPHIGVEDYEVSSELAREFVVAFGEKAACGRNLDLTHCVRAALLEAGVAPQNIAVCEGSTASSLADRFFSYRASGGVCGRHAALAVMRSQSSAHESIEAKEVAAS